VESVCFGNLSQRKVLQCAQVLSLYGINLIAQILKITYIKNMCTELEIDAMHKQCVSPLICLIVTS